MTSGIVLGIGLGFNDHAPEQAAVVLAFHQPAADELRSNDLGWTAEEGLRESGDNVGNGRGSYGSGLGEGLNLQSKLLPPKNHAARK